VPVTPNLHLELFAPLGVGWREDATAGALLDYDMMLIDAAIEALILTSGVLSVNGKSGIVVLSAADVGADPAEAAAAALVTAEKFAVAMAIALG
jgi:hypothetical protein